MDRPSAAPRIGPAPAVRPPASRDSNSPAAWRTAASASGTSPPSTARSVVFRKSTNRSSGLTCSDFASLTNWLAEASFCCGVLAWEILHRSSMSARPLPGPTPGEEAASWLRSAARSSTRRRLQAAADRPLTGSSTASATCLAALLAGSGLPFRRGWGLFAPLSLWETGRGWPDRNF